MATVIGETLGSFRIVSELGTGGMGVIYRAEHQMIGKRAAIKVLRPELSADREVIGRFFNEAKAVTAIDHPGLVDVYDFGYAPDGSAYIVMELLAGESLGTRLRRDKVLPVDAAVALMRQLCGALAAAHAHQIVHRDLKPDNIYLTPDPDVAFGLRAKVLDFGIAKLAPGIGGLGTPETRTGMLLGTPLYMAPEQCRGAGEVDHRADIYALGVILFEMVCGQVPFTGVGLGEVIAKHQYVAAPSPRSLAPALPLALDALISRMLAKPPEDRPQSMHEVLAALDGRTSSQETVATLVPATAPTMAAGTQPSAGTQPTAAVGVTAPAQPRSRRRGLYLGIAAAATIGGAGVVALALRSTSSGPLVQLERLPAETEFVLGVDVAKPLRTPLWREESATISAAAAHADDEHLLEKLRTRCDLDPFRDLHTAMYAIGTATANPGDGVLVLDGAWDRDKLERCVAQIAPEIAAHPQPAELAGSPIRQYGSFYIAWIDPHTAALTGSHDGLPYLRLIARHSSSAADRADLHNVAASIDHGAVLWFAGAAPTGLPACSGPWEVLVHATETSLSIALGDELDGHFTMTQPGRAADLERQLEAALAKVQTRLPLAGEVHVAVHGDALAVDVHLGAAKVDMLATRIEAGLRESMGPEPPPTN
jgi:tRNA A-37 threonylcarbamoyl transferase component Bud32